MKTTRRNFLKTIGLTTAALAIGALGPTDIEMIYPDGCPYCGKTGAEWKTMSDVDGRWCHRACWHEHKKRLRPEVRKAWKELYDATPEQKALYQEYQMRGDSQEIAALRATGRI